MAAATPTLISLADYLRTSFHPDRDLVNGQLEERHMGEYPHSKLQSRLIMWFGKYEADWHINPLTEQRIQVSSDHVRICNVVLLAASAPRENVTRTPPLLCIDILSPRRPPRPRHPSP